MRSLEEVFNDYYADESANMKSWCDSIYNRYFRDYYGLVDHVRNKVRVDEFGVYVGKLSDMELEMILTDLPMDLYTASESLNQLRLELEMIRLKYKKIKRDIHNCISEEGDKYDMLMEHDLLIKAYEAVIARAENERSACRELIMGAKKIWDSRRSAEQTNPVKEVVTDLPDYKDVAPKSYIK